MCQYVGNRFRRTFKIYVWRNKHPQFGEEHQHRRVRTGHFSRSHDGIMGSCSGWDGGVDGGGSRVSQWHGTGQLMVCGRSGGFELETVRNGSGTTTFLFAPLAGPALSVRFGAAGVPPSKDEQGMEKRARTPKNICILESHAGQFASIFSLELPIAVFHAILCRLFFLRSGVASACHVRACLRCVGGDGVPHPSPARAPDWSHSSSAVFFILAFTSFCIH